MGMRDPPRENSCAVSLAVLVLAEYFDQDSESHLNSIQHVCQRIYRGGRQAYLGVRPDFALSTSAFATCFATLSVLGLCNLQTTVLTFWASSRSLIPAFEWF